MSSEDLTQFNEALNYYYKLKGQYDSKTQKEVERLIKNSTLTIKEKQRKFQQLKKKCIICGKDGGTIFNQKDNLLIAKCGNQENPCKLDIQLQKGKYNNITNEMNKLKKKININKIDTISSKLNFLFGFISESTTIEEFNKLKVDLIQTVKIYQKIHENYQNIISNSVKKQEIIQKNSELLIYIQNLNELIKNFEDSKDLGYLKDTVELYLHNIKETVEKIRNVKYIYNNIERNEEDNTYRLIQEEYTQSQLLIPVGPVKNKILVLKK